MVRNSMAWLGLFGALYLLAMPVSGEVYQWRDADGKVHFSDRKPVAAEAQDISEAVKQNNVDDSSGERKKLQQLFAPETAVERQAREQKQQQTAQQQQERQKRCDTARKQLSILRGPVYFTRDDGSEYEISEAERERLAQDYAAQIKKYCS